MIGTIYNTAMILVGSARQFFPQRTEREVPGGAV